MGLSSPGGQEGQEAQTHPLPPKGPLPHSRFPAESFPHRTLQRRPGRLMNELHCMGRKKRTRSRGQSPSQPADQSSDRLGTAAGLVPAPTKPALARARPPASRGLRRYSAPGAGENIKENEAIRLGDPGIQNSEAGAAAVGSPQRRRADGAQLEPLRGAEVTRTWTRQVGEEWL